MDGSGILSRFWDLRTHGAMFLAVFLLVSF